MLFVKLLNFSNSKSMKFNPLTTTILTHTPRLISHTPSFSSLPLSPSSLPNALLIDKLLFRLKQNDFSSLRTHLLHSNSTLTLTLIPQLLQKCQNYPLLLPNLIQTIASTSPNPSIIATLIHFLVQSKKLPEAQSLLLRIIRKSGVSHVEVLWIGKNHQLRIELKKTAVCESRRTWQCRRRRH
ncbi:hypothetical protein MtrunA17_Chr5g0442251 [Medicago truncatula]|uniref:Uncharacterized protein n=1 Tax=Medicago truncatula TaxID=3880 RepID=A0A396I0A7_MEDTR|nr:hypothetical protein MtrunA17_Chr5g0442251 [Medicago truncatula]